MIKLIQENQWVVTESCEIIAEYEEKVKTECLATKSKWENITKNEVIKAFIKLCFKSILKFLLPCLASKEKYPIMQQGQKQPLGSNHLYWNPLTKLLGKVK